MSEVDINYDLKVLKMMLNTHLDETVSITEEGLNSLESNRDRVVYGLATKIYSQSGHKVELSTARDVVNSRIGAMKFQLAEAHRVAEEEVRRIAREEAHQAAEEARRAIEEEARLHARQNKAARILGGLGEDEGKARVFVMVQKVLSEQLSVDENEVNLDSHIVDDLSADGYDVAELVIALEEEFSIEITDEEASDRLNLDSYSYSSSWFSFSSGSSGSNSITTACEVKQVVDLIYEKLSA